MAKRKRDRTRKPPYTYERDGAWWYKPYRKGAGTGQTRPTLRLCDAGVPMSAVWQAWEALQDEAAATNTLRWLLDAYKESPQFRERRGKPKAIKTIREQERQIDVICNMQGEGGRTFGAHDLARITTAVIQRYIDWRAQNGAPTAGNREASLISAAWNWGLQRGRVLTPNPCRGVERNAEQARERYVTDEEYAAFRGLLVSKRAPWYVWPAMELAYLCRLRASEVFNLNWANIADDELWTPRLKGSRDARTVISARLSNAIAICESQAGRGLPEQPLFRNRTRGRVNYEGFSSVWQRLMKHWTDAGNEHFTYHDLKAKGVTDFEGDKQAAGGFRSPSMVAVYDRKAPRVDSTR